MKPANWVVAACAALALSACDRPDAAEASPVPTTGVTDAMIAEADGNEWLTYGRDYGEQRFSPLTQINDTNVADLGLAWFADLETARGQEATPLMHDGVLYVSTAWSMVKAFDARTGELKWSYDPQVPRATLAVACCDAVNRGVALYGDKVYVATLDGYLVALDQDDGSVAWRKEVVPDHRNYTITGAPRVAKGKVLIGSGGAEYRARGFIAAFDWATGEELWRFHTVPGNPENGFENQAMERAAATWGGEWWKLGGGGTVWDSITYDSATNLVLFGTGNAEPWNPAANGRDQAGGEGPGDNLFTSSIVAVNADTGEYAWHFQETPEDRWDFDSNAQITLADLTIDGAQKRVSNYEVAEQAQKNDDICIAFASIDPHKGKYGAREARDLVENHGVKGFKFHGIAQNAHPADRMAYPIYEVINEYKLPAIFHTGHSGMGTGMRGGGGMRLKYGQPILVDDVAVDFPDMKIILAHPSWPWVDESLSMALHKENVFIDLSGWSPKYFPKQVIQHANTQLKHKMMFGSDFPLIHPDKWIATAQEVGFREEVMPLILKDNAARVLGLA